MGFKSLLDNQVQNLMRTLGDVDGLAPGQTYVVTGDQQTYDPATRATTTARTSLTGVQMVLARFSSDEMDDSIIIETDAKAIIASKDLPNVRPKAQDEIIVTTTTESLPPGTYEVMKPMGVPGNSVHILHIRRND